jgi:DGQHR domain-containing protein
MIKNPINCPCFEVEQPVGSFYLARISRRDLIDITFADIRRIEREESDVERVLGIQRPLSNSRVKEIGAYVNTVDANFPTSIILAIDSFGSEEDEEQEDKDNRKTEEQEVEKTIQNIFYNKSTRMLELRRGSNVAKILDGQHRIAGLKLLEPKNEPFDLPVTIFVDADIEQQALIFATINKTQTKVNKSLVYDLYELAKNRSPEKTCHNIALVLNHKHDSPFHDKIRILGAADDAIRETLTQATFVEALLKYVSDQPMKDRDYLKRNPGKKLPEIDPIKKRQLFLYDWMRNEEDAKIAKLVMNYFSAVQKRWPTAWNSNMNSGLVLNRTTGYLGLMKFFKDACVYLTIEPQIPTVEQFCNLFKKVTLGDNDFTKEKLIPGTTGQNVLYQRILKDTGVPKAP